MKCLNLFNIYRKLKYIQKLKLVQKFDTMLCAVKKLCKPKVNLFRDFLTAELTIETKVDMKKIRYIRCYGYPENGCFDLELLEKV